MVELGVIQNMISSNLENLCIINYSNATHSKISHAAHIYLDFTKNIGHKCKPTLHVHLLHPADLSRPPCMKICSIQIFLKLDIPLEAYDSVASKQNYF